MERNTKIAASPISPVSANLALARLGPLVIAYTNAVSALLVLLKESIMPVEIDNLAAEVQETVGIVASAVTLINGIGAKIQTAVDAALAANPGVDLTPLTALTADLNASSEALAQAVLANP